MPFLPPNQQRQSTEGTVTCSNQSISPAGWATAVNFAACPCLGLQESHSKNLQNFGSFLEKLEKLQ